MIIDDRTALIDLESLPQDARVGMDLRAPPGWKPAPYVAESRQVPRNYKSEEAIARWRAGEMDRLRGAEAKHREGQREKGEAWYRDASLDPFRGRIACVGIAVGEGDVEVIDCVDDERRGLLDLQTLLADVKPQRIVAHNMDGFDGPFIQIRALKWGADKLAAGFHQDKPWDGFLVDTHEWWPATHYRGRNRSSAKLDNICGLLGIERRENPIGGAQVLDAYIDGRWGDVVAHCRADVRDLREVFRRLAAMRGEG
jgi:hypothetical protein